MTIVYTVPLSVAVVMMVLALILVPTGIIGKVRKASRQKARNEQLATGTRSNAGGTTAPRPGQADGESPRPPARPYGM